MKKHIQKIALLASALFVTVISTSAFAQTAPAAKPASEQPAPTKPANTDKIVGKDAKGDNIYEGPKGGRYTMNAKGEKHYLPKPKPAPAPAPASTTPEAPKK